MGRQETAGGGKSGKEKDRRLAITKAKIEQQKKIKEEEQATGKEKKEFEIARLENVISLCNYDLQNPAFKGSPAIIKKKEEAEKRLQELKNEL